MKKFINILLAIGIIIVFGISISHYKQDINDIAYVIAIGVDKRL